MQNTNYTSTNEKELLLELEHILVNHRYKCSAIENISNSNSTYMYRIKKALNKSKVEEKRIAVLQTTIDSINSKIRKGMLFKEIFEPLPAIIEDELRNYSKNKIKDNKNAEKAKEIKSMEDNHNKEKAADKAEYISDIIDEILAKLDGCTRRDLQNLESEYINNLKVNTSDYGIVRASGEIQGALNTGMIESTRKNFKKTLYDDYRITLKDSEKLSDRMSDELLAYRVAALIYTNTMCSKRITKIRSGFNNKINHNAYNGLKKDVHFLGRVVREKYIDEYSISPKDEMIENFIGGQISFEGLMEKRDEVIRKRDLK